MKTKYILFFLLMILVFSGSCKKKDFQPELVAKTGPDTTATIGDTVWLDASPSSGSEYEVLWEIQNQPADDSISLPETDSAFFIPWHNGTYQVKLTISKGEIYDFDYQTIVVSGGVILDHEVSQRTRLKKISLPGEVDYLAIRDVNVTAELIIDMGVIIEFRENASLRINEGGKVYAERAEFIAADSTWKGISLKTQGNTITGCLISNAGNYSFTEEPGDAAAVIMFSGATLAFSGNTISRSGGKGLIVRNGSDFIFDSENQVNAFHNNQFIENAEGPMVIPAYVISYLPGQKLEQETPDTYIEISESAYPASVTINPRLDNIGLPYLVTGLLTINKNLTINKGAELYFEMNAGLLITGNLDVSGSPDQPVMMNAANPLPGSWMGIYVKGQLNAVDMHILNAGGEKFTGLEDKASLIAADLVTMKNSTISGSGGIGLYMPGTAHIRYPENFDGNTITDNATSAARLRMDDVSKVVNGNSVISPDGTPAVEVHMGVDDPLGTWTDLAGNYDYKILESLTLKATKNLVIEAGVNIKMNAGTKLYVSGGLKAAGSAGSGITIEGVQSIPGHWDGIFINSTDTVQLDHVLIRDGGGALEDKANLIIQTQANTGAGTVLSVSNSTINNSQGYGVIIKSGASDFGINDPASNNTIEGDLGGFRDENIK